ncbi:NUDIX hydrolase [Kocuria sp. LUK]|uniref:NUDIX domain-containing protein n=1 Tax=Kocuria TaxID=57493 RepID=UPI001E4F8DCE|nr:NUDIX hydrolase [Kocuria sp. LUK]MCD1145584.1 NUDIX hydrolase [Kocuria sp. LUK]
MSSYLSETELRKFVDSLPTRRLAAEALIRDPEGRVLIVEPNYKPDWTVPGGTVEAGEDPRTGCFREVAEEVGLDLPPGRLLVVAHGVAMGVWGDSVSFVYDGGTIAADTPLRIQEEELLSHRWAAPEELDRWLRPGLALRLRRALDALREGTVVETVNGDG